MEQGEVGADAPDTPAPSGDRAAGAADPAAGSDAVRFELGQSVRLRHALRFLRSADPMPMLRPPDLVDGQEIGVVQELRSLGRLAVRFRRGVFLIDAADLMPLSSD